VRVQHNGTMITLGSPAFCNLPVPLWRDQESIIGFRKSDEAGYISIGQVIRPDAVQTITALKQDGYRLIILSGDQKSPVEALADELGVGEWIAAAKPAEKLAYLDSLKSQGRTVLMVGDGLNDAPSLAAASVSLSPATGAHVTQATADAVFMGDRLGAVRDTLLLCKRGQRIMRDNFLLALVYNLIAVPLAIGGHVTPLIAAAAMSGSSILVTLNALRARTARGTSL